MLSLAAELHEKKWFPSLFGVMIPEFVLIYGVSGGTPAFLVSRAVRVRVFVEHLLSFTFEDLCALASTLGNELISCNGL